MLKHGRFLQNLVVSPVYPEPIYAKNDDGDDDVGSKDDNVDENADEWCVPTNLFSLFAS